MKKYLLLWVLLFFSVNSFTQEWKIYKDNALYYMNTLDYKNAAENLEKLKSFNIDSNWYFTTVDLGITYWRLGKYDKVEPLLNEGLNRLEIYGDTNSNAYLLPLDCLGDYFYLYKEDLKKADQIFSKIIRIRELNDLVYDPQYYLGKNNLADIFRKEGMLESAIEIYQDIEKKFENVDFSDKNNTSLAICISPTLESMADVYRDLGKIALAIKYTLKAISIIENAYGINSEVYIDAKEQLGNLYRNVGEYFKAEETFLDCSNIANNLYNETDKRYLSLQSDLGNCFIFCGEFEKANVVLRKTKDLQKKILGTNNIGYLSTLSSLSMLDSININIYSWIEYIGFNYQEKEDYSNALKIYTKAKNICESKNIIDSNYANVIWEIGFCYNNMKKFDSAEYYDLKTINILKKIGNEDKKLYSLCLTDLASIYLNKSHLNEAESTFLYNLKIIEKHHGIYNDDYIYGLQSLVTCYRIEQNFSKCEELLFKAILIQQKLHGIDSSKYASFLKDLGEMYIWNKDLRRADSCFSKSLKIFQNIGGEKKYDYISCLRDKAGLFNDVGDYKNAIDLYIEICQLQKESKKIDTNMLLGSLLDLANSYNYSDNQMGALNTFNEIKKKFEEYPSLKSTRQYSIFLNGLSLLYYDIGDFELSEKNYLFALNEEDIYLKDYKDQKSITALNISNFYLNIKQNDKAEKYAILSLNLEDELHGKKAIDYARILQHLSAIYYSKGNFDKSIQIGIEAVELKIKLLGEENFEVANGYMNIACNYMTKGKFDKAENYLYKITKINNKIFKNNFNALTNKNQLDYINKFKSNYSEIADYCFLFLKDNNVDLITKDKYSELGYNNELFYKNLSVRFHKRYNKDTENNHLELIDNWEIIKNKLKKDEVAIEIINYTSKNDTMQFGSLFISSNCKHPIFIFNFWAEKEYQFLLKKQTGWHDSILTNKMYKYSFNWNDLNYYIYHKFDSLLGGIKNIFISPSSLLYYTNFSAIPVDSTTTFGEKYNLHILGTTADVINYKPIYLTKNSIHTALIYGGIDYDKANNTPIKSDENKDPIGFEQVAGLASRGGGAVSKFGYLKGTEEETKNIQDLCSSNRIKAITITGENATELSFKQLSGKKEPFILHIATHGYFFPEPEKKKHNEPVQQLMEPDKKNVFKWSDDPLLRSGLIFAGANKAWGNPDYVSNDSTEDGILTSYEISNLDLSNCQLVVLSACETGLGDIKGSEGVFGLQRAFKMAGAKNIIMSLWKVPDAQTSELMTLFYNYCFAGKSVHDALQAAQTDMRKKGYAPYYWAAFKLLE